MSVLSTVSRNVCNVSFFAKRSALSLARGAKRSPSLIARGAVSVARGAKSVACGAQAQVASGYRQAIEDARTKALGDAYPEHTGETPYEDDAEHNAQALIAYCKGDPS